MKKGLLFPVICWATFAGLFAPGGRAVATEPEEMPGDLGALIDRVRDNEALLRNLTATVQITYTQRKNGEDGQLLESFPEFEASPGQPITIRKARIVTEGQKFHFTSEEAISLGAGLKFTAKQMARFDGDETLIVDEGVCETLFRGRYEPGRMLAPHCWGFFEQEINVPLSVYLGGTAALKAHPRARRFPVEHWISGVDRPQAARVRVQFVGMEMVGDLQCAKVQVERWHKGSAIKYRPELEFLWLAKDRNFHVARYQADLKGHVPGQWAWVTAWRAVAKGVWLPAVVKCETLRGVWCWTTQEAFLDSKAAGTEKFPAPEPSPDVPRLVIDEDGHLEQAPPVRAAAASSEPVSFSSLLRRLEEEEAKFDRLDVTLAREDALISLSAIAAAESGGGALRRTTRLRSVVARDQLFARGEDIWRDVGGAAKKTGFRIAWNGQWARSIDDLSGKSIARLGLRRPDESHAVRPHAILFDDYWRVHFLSQFLKYGRLHEQQMVVTCGGDEQIAGLHCHKLKCELPAVNHRFFIWLARDRNLLAVRFEYYLPGWSAKFPGSLACVDELKEIAPGIWFPWRMKRLELSFSRSAARPLVDWRREIRVESATFDPDPDESLFDTLEVPAGTEIEVQDSGGRSLDTFVQAHSGNIELAPGKLAEWRKRRDAKPVQ